MFSDVLILAGGSGERLWPASTDQRPKQFMSLGDGENFLQSALIRASALGVTGSIYVITRRSWIDLVVSDVRDLARRTGNAGLASRVVVMGEPQGRNTAAPIAWLARNLLAGPATRDKANEPNILMMASDHVIRPLDAFVSDVRAAADLSLEGNLVSFAIPPTHAATGYGYIRAGAAIELANHPGASSFRVESFREKPSADLAAAWLEDGHYYWNSGIYGFRADFYLDELSRHESAISVAFEGLGVPEFERLPDGIRILRSQAGVDEAYDRAPSTSIDYAVSERCERSVSVRASFTWDDVGTWDSLSKYVRSDAAALVESRDCFVQSDIPVALCGVDDLIVVIKGGKALVARRGETGLVKDALADLKKKGLL